MTQWRPSAAPVRTPRTRAQRARARVQALRGAERGMTLIEIGIALMIVAMLVFVAVPTIESVTGVKARQAANQISGAIRYMYSESALTGHVCRMVFDMDERQYWAECTESHFTVDREKEKSRGGARFEEPEKKESRRSSGKELDDFERLKEKVEKRAEFAEYNADEVKKKKLPDGAELSVWTAHQKDKYTKGKAFLYFFPQGHTERALVYVSSNHGDVYTLSVSPLNGRVRVSDKEEEIPRS